MNELVDLNGKKFGKFTVINNNTKKIHRTLYLECECECGKKLWIEKYALINGRRNRCRDCTYEDLMGKRFGNQTVIGRDHESKRWIVLCDCGTKKLKNSQLVKCTSTCGRCASIIRVGQKFGKLKILSVYGYDLNRSAVFECICDCGNKKTITSDSLIRGRTRSCGCLVDEKNLINAKKLIGTKFGYLKITGIHGYEPGTKRIVFSCKCKCGKITTLKRKQLGEINSCGCLLKDSRPCGENHHLAKISNENAETIRDLYKSGLYLKKDLAKLFNISETNIGRIISNKAYKK